MTFQANYSLSIYTRFFCVCIFILYQVFFSCGFCFPILAGRQSSTDRMGFQRCYYYYLFFSGRCIRIFRHSGRSLSTRQDVLTGLVFIFKFIFLLPFTFNNNNNNNKKLKSTEKKINIS